MQVQLCRVLGADRAAVWGPWSCQLVQLCGVIGAGAEF